MDASKSDGVLLASAASTSTRTSDPKQAVTGKGVALFVDFTATPNNTETATVSIQAKDPVSGKWATITGFTALTSSALGAAPTTETYVYTLYPGGVETAATAKHEVQALPLPKHWRAVVTHSASGSWTYSVGFSYLV